MFGTSEGTVDDASASVSTRENSFVSAGFCPTAFAQTMYAKSALTGSGAATYLCVRKIVSIQILGSLANGHPAMPSALALLAGGDLRQLCAHIKGNPSWLVCHHVG